MDIQPERSLPDPAPHSLTLTGPEQQTPLPIAGATDTNRLSAIPVQPRLRPAVTIIWSVLFVLAIEARILTVGIGDRADFLESPEEFLEQVCD